MILIDDDDDDVMQRTPTGRREDNDNEELKRRREEEEEEEQQQTAVVDDDEKIERRARVFLCRAPSRVFHLSVRSVRDCGGLRVDFSRRDVRTGRCGRASKDTKHAK